MIEEIAKDDPRLPAFSRHHAAAFPRGWSAEELGDLAERGLLIADDADAFALFSLAADEAELLTIVTPKAARRQGRAQALLSAAYPMLAGRGATRIFLEVAEVNASARRLYETNGFAETGRRKKYYGDVDAILMSRGVS